MTAVRARVEVAALQTLLTGLGVLMALASRRVDRFRRQVTRDLLLEIRSADGARQQYHGQGVAVARAPATATRSVVSSSPVAPSPAAIAAAASCRCC